MRWEELKPGTEFCCAHSKDNKVRELKVVARVGDMLVVENLKSGKQTPIKRATWDAAYQTQTWRRGEERPEVKRAAPRGLYVNQQTAILEELQRLNANFERFLALFDGRSPEKTEKPAAPVHGIHAAANDSAGGRK